MKLLIIGFSAPGHMGGYLSSAATHLGLEHQVIDAAMAEARSRIERIFYWRLCGKRPARLARFAARVLDACGEIRPDVVLTTGRAPLDESHIRSLRRLGAKVINYSTDDPWNPVLRAQWFISALPSYDAVFSPRRANFDDFRRCGVRAVHYMPFAYDPGVHRPWPDNSPRARASDVLFVGGCDAARLPFVSALIDAGLEPALFGLYWNRHAKTRAHWRGVGDQDTIRAASASAKVCLCMVRRANRDGHVMRSFEVGAIGGCVMAEDTADHREIFGPEDHAVRYFRTLPDMVEQAKTLVVDAASRRRLARNLRERMAVSRGTYADRLAAMLEIAGRNKSSPERAQ